MSTLAGEAMPGAGDRFETFGRHPPTHKDAGTVIEVPFVYRWPLQNARVVGSQGYAGTSQVAAAMARD